MVHSVLTNLQTRVIKLLPSGQFLQTLEKSMKKWHGCGTCPCSTHVQTLHHLYIIYISSGKLTVCYWKWFIKSLTVDLLYLFQMVIFHSYAGLPEGYTSLLWRNVQYHVAWSEFNLLSPVDHTHAIPMPPYPSLVLLDVRINQQSDSGGLSRWTIEKKHI